MPLHDAISCTKGDVKPKEWRDTKIPRIWHCPDIHVSCSTAPMEGQHLWFPGQRENGQIEVIEEVLRFSSFFFSLFHFKCTALLLQQILGIWVEPLSSIKSNEFPNLWPSYLIITTRLFRYIPKSGVDSFSGSDLISEAEILR